MTNYVHALASYGIKTGVWDEMDRIYLTNKIMSFIGLDDISPLTDKPCDLEPVDLIAKLVEIAVDNNSINDTFFDKEVLEGRLGDLITPTPKQVNTSFHEKYKANPRLATDYFYELSKNNDYIKTKAIAKNIEFPYKSEFGELLITINLSKPEKDPKAIQKEASSSDVNYPKCMLCMENEGYKGRIGYPNRLNHRVVRFPIGEETWAFQYSPYAYYNEHSIIFSEEHRPMKIDKLAFEQLLNVVDYLPHYFAGSNADLPIVGGSILSHNHYQAGQFTFPIELAPILKTFTLEKFKDVSFSVVKWPMSVIRLQSENKNSIIKAAENILKKWQAYSDEDLDIVAVTPDGTLHHTITPIARKKEDTYELDLVLRDNNVSKEHPDGIFHPHKEYHHIKKENIGLIEVMGLAILPPRLKDELSEVELFLLDKPNNIADYHISWANSLKENHEITNDNVAQVIQDGVGEVFSHVLENAGVYKLDDNGQAGMTRFIEYLK